MDRKMTFIKQVIPLIAVFLTASCNLPGSGSTAAPAAVPDEIEDASSPPIGDQAISIFGPGMFTLSLPEGWDVSGPDVVTDANGSTYELWLLGVDPSPNQGPGLSKVVIGDAAVWTPEAFVKSQCSTCPAHDFEDVTIGGKPGSMTEIGGGDVPIMITWYFLVDNGKFIAIAIHDPLTLEPLQEVIASIQFEE